MVINVFTNFQHELCNTKYYLLFLDFVTEQGHFFKTKIRYITQKKYL